MSVPVILVGVGEMGRAWLRAVNDEPRAELAGIVDLDLTVARRAAREAGAPQLPVSDDAVGLARETGAQALINVTVPRAHHPVTTAALFAGLPVLSEKPVAQALPEALSLAAAAEVTGELFLVSQSRRYNPQLYAFKEKADQLGRPGILHSEFFKAPHFGGFREEMEHPLLVDMAIHPFDTARFVLGSDPVSVYCEEFNPPWSWYRGDAAASAIFEMAGGSRFAYTGSWCSPGRETSWNGEWRLSAEYGSAQWDGEQDPQWEGTEIALQAPHSADSTPHPDGAGIAGALSVFLEALEEGSTPGGEVHQNIMSLVMVEAAVQSSASAQKVTIDDVLERAREQALLEEKNPAVKGRLNSWSSVRSALDAVPESTEA